MYWSIQGNFGLGKAIEYFTSKSIPVSIPLNDTQKYDLVVDIDNKLYKVSVKTSRQQNENGTYTVALKKCGGTGKSNYVQLFDNKSCDYVFALLGNNKTYLIPSDKIESTTGITIGNKYTEYEVESDTLADFINKTIDAANVRQCGDVLNDGKEVSFEN